MATRLDLWNEEQVRRAVGKDGSARDLLAELHAMCRSQGMFVADLVARTNSNVKIISNKKSVKKLCPYCKTETLVEGLEDHMKVSHSDLLAQLVSLKKTVSAYVPTSGKLISSESWGIATTLFAFPYIETQSGNDHIKEHHAQIQDGLSQTLGGDTYITSLQSIPTQQGEISFTHIGNCSISELYTAVKSLPFTGDVSLACGDTCVVVKKGEQKAGNRTTLTWEGSSSKIKEVRRQLNNIKCEFELPNSRAVTSITAVFPSQQAAVKCFINIPGAVFSSGTPSAFVGATCLSINASDVTLSELLRRYLMQPGHMVAAIASVAWAIKAKLFTSCNLTPSILIIMYIHCQLAKGNITFITPSSIALNSCKQFPKSPPPSLSKTVDSKTISDAGNYITSFFQFFVSEEALNRTISISRPYQEVTSKAKGLHVEDPFTMEVLSRDVNEISKLKLLVAFRDTYRQIIHIQIPHGGLFKDAKCKICDKSLPPLSPVSYCKAGPHPLCLLCTKERDDGLQSQNLEKDLSQVTSLLESWSGQPVKIHMKEIGNGAVWVKTKSNGR